MKIPNPLFLTGILLITGLLLIIPVIAETTTSTDMDRPSITAVVSPSTPKVGDTVIISGTAKGGNLTPGISMWIFAGNYVNITNVPVNAYGSYSKSINTTDLPPAYYYVFVQHPGSDNKFNINVTGYSGQVKNTNTGAIIFNFTGTGSVNDNAAAIALSNAFNSIGVDDIFSKTGVQLLPAVSDVMVTKTTVNGIQATIIIENASQNQGSKQGVTGVATTQPINPNNPTISGTMAIPPTTKAPLSTLSTILGIGIVMIGIVLRRKN